MGKEDAIKRETDDMGNETDDIRRNKSCSWCH